MISFKGRHFPKDMILMSVRWKLAYPLSYRNIEELMEEGVKMNLKLCLSITAITTALLCQSAFAEKNEITFKNQRGSILELNILDDNKIAGYFTTAVASKTCPEAVNKKRPITGYLIGNAITFSVVYPMCESVLSVSGNFDNEKKSIDTLAILNKQANDATQEGPGARFIGHDSYQKIG